MVRVGTLFAIIESGAQTPVKVPQGSYRKAAVWRVVVFRHVHIILFLHHQLHLIVPFGPRLDIDMVCILMWFDGIFERTFELIHHTGCITEDIGSDVLLVRILELEEVPAVDGLEEHLFLCDPVRVDVFCDEARISHTDAVFARSHRLCQLITALMTAVEYQFDKTALGCPVAL